MNTTMVRPAPAPGTATGRRQAVLALARVEAVRLFRHPITIVAILMLFGFWVSGWITNEANHDPVLQDVDRDTELGMMLLIGGAALIASNLAVLRAHRNGTTALSDVLVLPYPQRTAAHLLAVLPLGLLVAALSLARIAVLLLVPAAGRPNPFELATGPVIVLLFGALGVLFGRLTRSPIVAPLAMLGLLAILIVAPLFTNNGPGRWYLPVVAEGEAIFAMPAPVYLMARPAAPHLAYLAGLAVLVALAALARSGARTVRLVVVAVVALAVTVAGGVLQTAPVSRSVTAARLAAASHPATQETCRSRNHVTYCAFPDFVAWIPGWDAEVQGVLHRVPAAVAQRPLAVRQRIILHSSEPDKLLAAWTADDVAAGTPDAVTVGTRWGDTRSAAQLAGAIAYRIVTGHQAGATVCGAQAVLVGWLTGRASAASNTGLHLLVKDQATSPDKGVMIDEAGGLGIYLQDRQLTMALTLLGRPADEVGARVLRSWDELTSAQTTTERAAEILGVTAPPAPPAAQPQPTPSAQTTSGSGTRSPGVTQDDPATRPCS